MRTFILADNQAITNVGLQFFLAKADIATSIINVRNKKELITSLIQTPNAVVVLDYTLFDFESSNELIILQLRFPEANWLLFSDELNDEFLQTVLFSSSSFSILLKDVSEDEISLALKELSNGNRYISNSISNMLLDRNFSRSSQMVKQVLTPTELEILKEMALGKTTKDIAKIRFVSVHTIMTHRKNIFRKIDVNTIHEATKYAMRSGIVDITEYYI
jgi:DNA-binding NarL/FixJ family response regulator